MPRPVGHPEWRIWYQMLPICPGKMTDWGHFLRTPCKKYNFAVIWTWVCFFGYLANKPISMRRNNIELKKICIHFFQKKTIDIKNQVFVPQLTFYMNILCMSIQLFLSYKNFCTHFTIWLWIVCKRFYKLCKGWKFIFKMFITKVKRGPINCQAQSQSIQSQLIGLR